MPQAAIAMIMRGSIILLALSAVLAGLPAQDPATADGVGAEAPAIGHASGAILVRDDFHGSGGIIQGVPDEDIDGGGWKTPDAASQPRRDGGGRLVSGGDGSVAAIGLPPISPYGEISVTATIGLPGTGQGLGIGFTDAVHRLGAGATGPWLQMTGDGRMLIHRDAGTVVESAIIPQGPARRHPCTIACTYRLWNQTLSVAIDGAAVETVALASTAMAPPRCFVVEFDKADAGSSPSLGSLRIEYLPGSRPARKHPRQTVQVADASVAGITKAMFEASAQSGPDTMVEVSIPKGDYHFRKPDDEKSTGNEIFRTFGLKNVIIDWHGSRISIDDPRQGFQNLSNAQHVVVRNIAAIDYSDANLPFTQGTVRKLDAAKQTFDLDIDPGFPLPTDAFFAASRAGESWGQLIDPANPGRRKNGALLEYWIKAVTSLGGRLYRYEMKSPLVGMQAGDRFTDNPRPEAGSIFRIFDAQDVTLEHITGYACGGFWSVIYHDTAMSYFDVRVLVKPGRLMSGNADIATGVGNKQLWIENCRFEGNADDICHQFCGSGIFVADSVFRNSRRFGVWFNTSEFGVIRGCTFSGMGAFAIAGMKEPGMKEDIRFASRDVLCTDNAIMDMQGPAIGLEAMHTRRDALPHWNTYWRLERNACSSTIQIRNATDLISRGDTGPPPGAPATLDIDAPSSRDVRRIPVSASTMEPARKTIRSQP